MRTYFFDKAWIYNNMRVTRFDGTVAHRVYLVTQSGIAYGVEDVQATILRPLWTTLMEDEEFRLHVKRRSNA